MQVSALVAAVTLVYTTAFMVYRGGPSCRIFFVFVFVFVFTFVFVSEHVRHMGSLGPHVPLLIPVHIQNDLAQGLEAPVCVCVCVCPLC